MHLAEGPQTAAPCHSLLIPMKFMHKNDQGCIIAADHFGLQHCSDLGQSLAGFACTQHVVGEAWVSSPLCVSGSRSREPEAAR